MSNPRNSPSQATDFTLTGSVVEIEREYIWIETDDGRAKIYASELMLDVGEAPANRYAVGDHFKAYVFRMEPDPETGAAQFSIRRAQPYPEALARLDPGAVVSATVVNTYDVGIELDVDGVRGNAFTWDLELKPGDSPRDEYQPSDATDALVLQVDHDRRFLYLSPRRATPEYSERHTTHNVGDVVSAVVTAFQENGGLWLDVNGVVGSIYNDEVTLEHGDSIRDRYSPGDTIEAFIWDIAPDARRLHLSVRRNEPGYVERLEVYRVGDIVSAVVTAFQQNGGLWLDVDGVVSSIDNDEVALKPGETCSHRYAVGDTIEAFIWQVDRDQRDLALSIRRMEPGYAERLDNHRVGDLVSTVVTGFQGSGELLLDVDGVIGYIPDRELTLEPGESVRDHYAVGDTVEAFIWQVDRDARDLDLSLRRNAPGYLQRLDSHEVGDVVSAAVASFASDGGLWLDVDGVVGGISPRELSLEPGASSRDRYAVGDTIEAFIWQVDRDQRDLALSIRRMEPGYAERLATHRVGDVVRAVVTSFLRDDGALLVDVDGVIGVIHRTELAIEDDQSPRNRYAVGDTIEAFIWQVPRDSRYLDLSLRRAASGYTERLAAHNDGDVVSGFVIEAGQRGLWLDVAGIIAWIPAAELPLVEGQKPTDSYHVGDSIEGIIWQVDHNVRDIIVSVRRLAPDFAEQSLLLDHTVDAVVRDVPPNGVSVLVANFDVFIPPHELSPTAGGRPRFERGKGIRVVVTAIDANGKPTLSHRRALEGWETEVERLTPGVLVSNARVLPQPAFTDSDDRAVLDIGPIDGVIPEDEMSGDAASNLVTYGANQEYPVAVVEVDSDRRFAVVSHQQFDKRWQELAAEVSEGAEFDAELRTVDRVQAVLDLGDGLIGVMPSEQIGYSGNRERMPRERIGERFPVRVKGIDQVAHHIDLEHRDQQIEQLIGEGESVSLEFKASLRRSPRTGENDPHATYGVLKSIAGFLNSKAGGTLIIGVDDDGHPITGPNGDVGAMALDGYRNEDEMERALKDLVKNRIEAAVFDWLTFSFTAFRDTRILRVDCEPANREIWLKGGRSGKSKEEEFYLRMPASTDPLEGRELVRYISERFGG